MYSSIGRAPVYEAGNAGSSPATSTIGAIAQRLVCLTVYEEGVGSNPIGTAVVHSTLKGLKTL